VAVNLNSNRSVYNKLFKTIQINNMRQKEAIWLFSIMLMLVITIPGYSQSQKTFEFTIEGMSCKVCANTATQILKKVKGVNSVSVDLDSKRAIVVADIDVTTDALKKSLEAASNFEALFPGEMLLQPLTDKEKEGLNIETIKGGDKIDFKNHLTEGIITIFDFYADWCAPCKVFSPKVERLLLDYDNLALRIVDIVDWESALAKQLTKDYQLPALPFTLIFDDKGKVLGKVVGNDIEQVKEIIDNK